MAQDNTRSKIGVVVNPTAGLGKGARTGAKVMQELRQHGVEVIDLSGKSAHDALARARAACLEGLAALVVVGGDGMVNLGANATIETPTPLAIVASGSGNDFARALDLPVNDVSKSVEQIINAVKHGNVRALDAGLVRPQMDELAPARILKINPEGTDHHSNASQRWFAGTLSLGLDAAVNLQANTYSWPKGHLKYLRAVVACLSKYKPYGYVLEVDGTKRSISGTLAAVSNAPYFGGGIPIAPHASLTDGTLNLMLAKPLKIGGILKVFPKLYSGKHLQDPAVSTEEVTEIIIRPGDKGVFPPVAMADGEVIGPVPLNISVAPGALKVLH